MRFLLDHDVDAAVGRMLRQRHHQCWTASKVGLAAASDDALTVWASEHDAAVVSTDQEFGRRRSRNAIGWHVWLHCRDWEASEVLAAHVTEVVDRLVVRSSRVVLPAPGELIRLTASTPRWRSQSRLAWATASFLARLAEDAWRRYRTA